MFTEKYKFIEVFISGGKMLEYYRLAPLFKPGTMRIAPGLTFTNLNEKYIRSALTIHYNQARKTISITYKCMQTIMAST